jgi:prephenate dehydrogenase
MAIDGLERVGIIGLGLMGASLALDLRAAGIWVLGSDHDEQTVQTALAGEFIDQPANDLRDFDGAVDLLVLAVPVDAILNLIAQLPPAIRQPLLVMDLGSAKTQILAAMSALPERFACVGGHPICGRAVGGIQAAGRGLYQGAPFALCRTARTTDPAWETAWQLAGLVGARPMQAGAEAHDRYLAQVSHMPYLLACAAQLAPDPAARPWAGPGFASLTRLAGTPLSMIAPVLWANRSEVLAAIDRVTGQLELFKEALGSWDEEKLGQQLEKARALNLL